MVADKKMLLRSIPAVDRLLLSPEFKDVLSAYPKGLVLMAVNYVLDVIRKEILEGVVLDEASLSVEYVSARVVKRVKLTARPSLRPVINATGVIVHTNLGRSILPEKVLKRFGPLGGGYSNLEYDLKRGERGSRYSHVEGILKELTSAEAAMVVNNNAAAVLICLETMAKGREVVVSRSELVEIGGSFRIPDVMRKSGAIMVEVGTTNKTHLRDYEEVICPDTAVLLKVHRSNFQIVGFTEDVETPQLVNLAGKYSIPVVEDLGSGCFIDFSKYGLMHEPTVHEVLAHGVDLVTFSGDKLLGGPQAGIILGRKDIVDAIRKNHLTRALRIDKLTLLALEETLNIYRDERAAVKEIPTLRMICRSYKSLKTKAQRLLKMTGKLTNPNIEINLIEGDSMAGGGALPLLQLPTCLLSLLPKDLRAHYIEEKFRACDPPIIVRVEKNQVLLDVRTIRKRELNTVAQAIRDIAMSYKQRN